MCLEQLQTTQGCRHDQHHVNGRSEGHVARSVTITVTASRSAFFNLHLLLFFVGSLTNLLVILTGYFLCTSPPFVLFAICVFRVYFKARVVGRAVRLNLVFFTLLCRVILTFFASTLIALGRTRYIYIIIKWF